MYTLEKEHQRNQLCVNQSTLRLSHSSLLFSISNIYNFQYSLSHTLPRKAWLAAYKTNHFKKIWISEIRFVEMVWTHESRIRNGKTKQVIKKAMHWKIKFRLLLKVLFSTMSISRVILQEWYIQVVVQLHLTTALAIWLKSTRACLVLVFKTSHNFEHFLSNRP